MNQSRSEVRQQQIGWRVDKVLDLSSKGHTEREIAQALKVSQATVHRDLVILRQQAKENIRSYIDEQLPVEYQKCLVGVTAIMKESWNTAVSAEAEGSNGRRDKLQALALAKECYAMKLDLLSSATVVERAVRFVENHRHENLPRGYTAQKEQVTKYDTAESR
jgi:hypothetical protein